MTSRGSRTWWLIKKRVIVELRDEACTLWASDWLSFRRKAFKVFPGSRFNFLVPAKDEMRESESDGKMTLGCPWLPLVPLFFLETPWSRLPSLRLLVFRLFPIILLYFGSLWPL